jgi:dTDP-glucose 4,6-dehydratase
VNELLKQENQVIGVSRSLEPNPVMLSYGANKNSVNFQFYPYDINHHFDEIISLIKVQKPQYIIDFAGQGMVAESWKTPEQWYQTNIVSKVKLHNYLNTCDFLERYVRVSTPEVYGNTLLAVDETQVYNPSTPYAVSHAAIDMSLKAYYQQYQFPMVLTRFANFYGPHQQLYRIIPRTIIYALINKKLMLHGGGKSERAFIYGDDVAKAICSVMDHGKIGEAYHFSEGAPISIANLVRKISDAMSIRFDDLVEVSEDRPGKDALYSMSTQKAENKLQWKPAVNLDLGLEKTIDWVKRNIDVIKTLPLEYQHKA